MPLQSTQQVILSLIRPRFKGDRQEQRRERSASTPVMLLGVGRFLNSSVQGPNWLTGGSAGPEGSVLALLILLLCAGLIHFRFPNAIYPDRPV